MPVIFKCECGQYLSVRNKYIDKKLQCPRCKNVVTVPRPDPKAEDEDTTSEEIQSHIVEERSQTLNSDMLLFQEGKRCQHCGARILKDRADKCSICGLSLS